MKFILTPVICLVLFSLNAQDVNVFNPYDMEVASIDANHQYTFKDIDGNSTIWRNYYSSGQTRTELILTKCDDGKNEWEEITWYGNGQMRSNIKRKGSQFQGELLIYWENGQQKRKDTYNGGILMDGYVWDSLGNEQTYFPYMVWPEFPGGERALMSFLGNNIEYPKKARRKGISGRVFVSFVVEKDGEISEIEIVKGLSKELDKEVLRVIRKMPEWIPGKVEGELARIKYNLPVKFTLQ